MVGFLMEMLHFHYKSYVMEMIKNILKRREESGTYLTHICRHCWSSYIDIDVYVYS